MKKNIIFTAIATLLLSVSCTQQEEYLTGNEAKTFTATIEQTQKRTALVNEVKVDWCEKDMININGADYLATPVAGKTGVAKFTLVEGEAPQEGPYNAVYPANLYNEMINGSLHVTFPQTQFYEPGKLNAPMIAISDNEKLMFRNICGVICFSLTGTDKIRRIEVMSDDIPLCGPAEVNPTTAKATIMVPKRGEESIKPTLQKNFKQNFITLDCGEGLQLSKNPENLYIYLPEADFNASKLRVEIYNINEERIYTIIARNPVKVERNNIYTFNIEVPTSGSVIDPVLPGVFTVKAANENENAKKVQFSRGNLQATYNETNNEWTWDFAEQQFSIIGEKNVYNGELTSKIDLFGWSSTASANNFGIFTATSGAEYMGTFKDWGLNINDRKWFTLSNEEWEYLLNRDMNSGISWAKTRYKDVCGLILFPDEINSSHYIYDFVKKLNNQSSPTINFPNSLSGFPTENLTEKDWDMLQSAGCVFLPCAGYRNGTSITGGSYGSYWSGTNDTGLEFSDTEVAVKSMNSFCGRSVRLVTIANALPNIPVNPVNPDPDHIINVNGNE